MFTYNKVASFSARPNHLTRFADFHPELRDEDISFYGLLTYAAQRRGINPSNLPGIRTLSFTEEDRDVIARALGNLLNDETRSRLAVCTFTNEDLLDNPVLSEIYQFSGTSEHGLMVVAKSEGLCPIPAL